VLAAVWLLAFGAPVAHADSGDTVAALSSALQLSATDLTTISTDLHALGAELFTTLGIPDLLAP
jgi:hypothetical protein